MTDVQHARAGAIEWAAATDIGRRRDENQDDWLVEETPAGLILAVADGMGGHPNGAWASRFALACVAEGVQSAPSEHVDLRQIVEETNAALRREAVHIGTPGAGTTLVAALIQSNRVRWVNVGDSRLYVVADDELLQISRDHNLAAEPGGNPRLANILTRCLGSDEADPDFGEVGLGAGLLLATDGLYLLVPHETLREALAAPALSDAAAALVDLANDAGGPDNITVVLARPAATG
ncbi:MAG: protein phosphatase 2C domain-containing protein [Dehalococcoidia bacterium]|nr:protein phosphatase 2C domain-containing protein [Dehalococcoidia bacterium]